MATTTSTGDTHDAIRDAMQVALRLAASGPLADPNPRVGAVVLDAEGRQVGQGWHAGAGTPHAEIVALAAAGFRARGGTAVITLEPCRHTGRTGPCTQALLDAGVARVVFGQADPSTLAGGGARMLREAGLDVVGGLLADAAAALNAEWTAAMRLGRPLVTWKFAATLDGRSAAADGSSRWITGPAARADVHERRAGYAAILVGTGTVLADDPQLTARYPDGSLRESQPLRVVVGHRPVPTGARVLDETAPTLLLPTRDPDVVLDTLWDKGIRRVWLEGGPIVAAAFLAAGLVDDVVAYLAPALLGAGPAAVGGLGIQTIDQATRLELLDVAVLGGDVRVLARPTSVAGR